MSILLSLGGFHGAKHQVPSGPQDFKPLSSAQQSGNQTPQVGGSSNIYRGGHHTAVSGGSNPPGGAVSNIYRGGVRP